MIRALAFSILLCVSIFSTSCSTVHDLRKGHRFERRVYGGTSMDLEIMSGLGDYYDMGRTAGSMLFVYSIVDLPFSFIADTVVLPYTICVDSNNERLKNKDAEQLN